MPNITQTMGIVTAYGAAVKGGYTGTYEEFCAEQAHFAENAQAVAQAKTDTEEYKRQAGVSAQNAATSETNASSSANSASQSATAAQGARTDAIAAKDQAVSAKDDAVTAKGAAETAQGKAEDAQASAEQAAEQLSSAVEQVETNKQDITQIKADLLQKANIDGAYSDLTAGNAEQLVSTVYEEDSVPYIFRTAGGSMDIGDREEDMLVGGSVAWNQHSDNSRQTTTLNGITFTNNGDGSITVNGTATNTTTFNSIEHTGDNAIYGHVYLIAGCPPGFSGGYLQDPMQSGSQNTDYGSGRVIRRTSTSPRLLTQIYIQGNATITNAVFKPQLFDLTQMFGSTIADYIYSLEQATAGAGVAWFRKLFPKDYYEHNAGELLSVSGLASHDTVGFNQWDEEWELGTFDASGNPAPANNAIRCRNYIPVFPNTTYYLNTGSVQSIAPFFYDSNKVYISRSSYLVNNTFITPQNCHYIKFGCPSSYGTTYKNDICINLHWDGERDGEYEPHVGHIYSLDDELTLRGIPKLDSANNLYYDGDTYESDGTVTRRYGIVDLGTLNWVYTSERFRAPLNNAVEPAATSVPNAIIPNYRFYSASVNFGSLDKGAAIILGGGNNLLIRDTSYTNVTEFKAAMSGVYLVYELATPTTETAEPYQNPQIVDDFGTEEYVTTGIVPVGHVTKYQPNLRAKLEMSPDSPDGDGDYIVRQANGENSYISLASTATIQDILARLSALEGNTNEG